MTSSCWVCLQEQGALLHRLLEPPDAAAAADQGGQGGQGGQGAASSEAGVAGSTAAASAQQQRHRQGAAANNKDWLADLRRRVGLVYNV